MSLFSDIREHMRNLFNKITFKAIMHHKIYSAMRIKKIVKLITLLNLRKHFFLNRERMCKILKFKCKVCKPSKLETLSIKQ